MELVVIIVVAFVRNVLETAGSEVETTGSDVETIGIVVGCINSLI